MPSCTFEALPAVQQTSNKGLPGHLSCPLGLSFSSSKHVGPLRAYLFSYVQVPISVVHKKGAVALDGTDTLVLYVYGAYGVPSDADFDATRLSLLDR